MKWILVVLIGGLTPVQTDVQFDKLSDCLSAEEQLRNTYADAYEAWDRSAALNIERRRDYRKAREFQERRLANTGTCIPHAGTDQPVTMTPRTVEQPAGIRASSIPATLMTRTENREALFKWRKCAACFISDSPWRSAAASRFSARD
jgi:hypothetical protein